MGDELIEKAEDFMLSKSKLTWMIEDTVKIKRLSYIDAVINICEENSIEVEDIKKFISGPIKDKLEAEAMNLNFLPRGNQLPI